MAIGLSVLNCDCQEKIQAAVEARNRPLKYNLLDVDVLTGRTVTNGVLVGGTKNRSLPAVHRYCPWCGRAYQGL